MDDFEGEHKTFPDELVAIEVSECQNHDEEGLPPSRSMRFSIREKAGYTLSVGGDQHITFNGHEVIHFIDLMKDVEMLIGTIRSFNISPATAMEMLQLFLEVEEQPDENES